MKRRFQGLHQADQSSSGEIPDGVYLVQVAKAQYRWHAQKPFYQLRFIVLEPQMLDSVGTVSAAQRRSLPAESVQQLPLRGLLSGKAGACPLNFGSATRSRRSWLA